MDHYPEDYSAVTIPFTTHAADGSLAAPSNAFEAADIAIYKAGDNIQKATTNGVVMLSPFDSIAGVHMVLIDTSNDTGDTGFWEAGAIYDVLLNPDETVDGVAAKKWIGKFMLGDFTAAQRATIVGWDTQIAKIGTANGVWESRFRATGQIDLSQYMDYTGSRSLTYTASGFTDFDAGTLRLSVEYRGASVLQITSGITSSGSGDQVITLPITAAEVAQLPIEKNCIYSLWCLRDAGPPVKREEIRGGILRVSRSAVAA